LFGRHKLSKELYLYTFSPVSSLEKPPLLHTIFREPRKGFTAFYQLQHLAHLRREAHKRDIMLLGFTSDCIGFSLAAGLALLTPTTADVAKGVPFIGLQLPSERFLFKYAGKYPDGFWPCWDHGRSTGVRQFKLASLKLVVCLEDDSTELLASISHLEELRKVMESNGLSSGIQSGDLELGLLFDQNPDTADRLLTLRIVELLEEWVPGSRGTQLVISALYYIFEPFRDPTMPPLSVIELLVRGRQISRLWRRYVELHPRLNPRSKRSGADKKGNFWSGPCYNGVEALVAAGICCVLVYKKHCEHLGPEAFYLRALCTHQTEKFAMDLSGE
jgi:hypothetical protein